MRRLIRRYCFPDIVSAALASLIFGGSFLQATSSVLGAVPRVEKSAEQMAALKQRILEIPPGTMIEVRLLDKQKIRGRLGEIADEGFNLQTAQGNKIETQKIAFADVKSFKSLQNSTGHKIGKGVLYGLAGIGALILILTLVYAGQSE